MSPPKKGGTAAAKCPPSHLAWCRRISRALRLGFVEVWRKPPSTTEPTLGYAWATNAEGQESRCGSAPAGDLLGLWQLKPRPSWSLSCGGRARESRGVSESQVAPRFASQSLGRGNHAVRLTHGPWLPRRLPLKGSTQRRRRPSCAAACRCAIRLSTTRPNSSSRSSSFRLIVRVLALSMPTSRCLKPDICILRPLLQCPIRYIMLNTMERAP